LDIIQVTPGVPVDELMEAARQLAKQNIQHQAPEDDLGLAIFVTPGDYATFAPGRVATARVGMHTYPIPFSLWVDKYRAGQRMVVTEFRQVPSECWPAELKCRSRMHYYLADRQAQTVDPEARALLLDSDGFVCEASTANVVAYFPAEGLVSPPREKILPGISIAVLGELAQSLNIPLVYRDVHPDELFDAEEVMLCSTSPCLLPVVSLDGRSIGKGLPGETFQRLIGAWSDLVEVDIVAQAARFARR
jgi:branched-subunit amino acid aminotransferase/4-amino-4-deoxychorismate lyase